MRKMPRGLTTDRSRSRNPALLIVTNVLPSDLDHPSAFSRSRSPRRAGLDDQRMIAFEKLLHALEHVTFMPLDVDLCKADATRKTKRIQREGDNVKARLICSDGSLIVVLQSHVEVRNLNPDDSGLVGSSQVQQCTVRILEQRNAARRANVSGTGSTAITRPRGPTRSDSRFV